VDGGDASTLCGRAARFSFCPAAIIKLGDIMQIKKLTPNLIVRDVSASLDFYRTVLGLETGMTVPDQSPYVFASVTNGLVEIFFNDQKMVAAEDPKLAATIGASLTLYTEVDNLNAVMERVKAARAPVTMEIKEQFYGMREFGFQDPDGYTITIAERM
jgi:uncharacterized glyoxalase superfamily protein PhnB